MNRLRGVVHESRAAQDALIRLVDRVNRLEALLGEWLVIDREPPGELRTHLRKSLVGRTRTAIGLSR